MIKISEKFVYCVTSGGLNDTINQIMACYKYCQKYNRKLAINSYSSTLMDDINNYFEINNNLIFELKSFCHFYKSSYSRISIKIGFDIDQEHNERLLINPLKVDHFRTKDFFKIFKLKEVVLDVLKKRYNQLPKDYVSVHIRNTDYRSNVEQFIKENIGKFAGKNVFLASDNRESIDYFKQNADCTVFTFSNIPPTNYMSIRGIHKLKVKNKKEMNIDSIVDLILLSLGKEIFYSFPNSTYSKNAELMMKDKNCKKNILKQL